MQTLKLIVSWFEMGKSRILLLFLLLPTIALAAKPKAKVADSPALTRLKSLVDETALQVDDLAKQTAATHDDEQLQRLGVRFQLFMRRTEAAMEALEAVMGPPDRATAEAYGRVKLETRMAKMADALRQIQEASGVPPGEDDPPPPVDHGPAAEQFRQQLQQLDKQADVVVRDSLAAGKDPARREHVREALTKLAAAQNALFQNVRQNQQIAKPRLLLAEAHKLLEPKILRVDRVLRLGALPPCPLLEAAKLALDHAGTELGKMLAELALVQTQAGLEQLHQRFLEVSKNAVNTETWQKLSTDELAEIQTLAQETVTPLTEQFEERAAALVKRFSP